MKRLFVGVSLVMGGVAPALAATSESPNFVLFLADDCSYYDLGCYGSADSITPNLDKFASEGMRFTKAYQATSISSPTRHNLYSGLWPVRSGAYPNHTFVKEGTETIVTHLQAQGYKVALVGKSHIAPAEAFPFDLYVPAVNEKGDDELNQDLIDKFVEVCSDNGDPFCLIVASNQPHVPWTRGDATQFDQSKLTLPPTYVDTPTTRKFFADYLAEINYMDQEFGDVMASLERHDVDDDSVVLFVSEQGNSLPFAKYTCYDVGVHSAFIVRWPGVVEAGSESDAMVEYVDVVPTFLDIAGGELLAPVDGESIKPVLLGKKDTHKRYSYSQFSDLIGYGIRSCFDGRYRYIENLNYQSRFGCAIIGKEVFQSWIELAKSDSNAQYVIDRYRYRPRYELYDVEADPYCMNNLAEDRKYNGVMRRLDKKLHKWMEYCGDKGLATEAEVPQHMQKGNSVNRLTAIKMEGVNR